MIYIIDPPEGWKYGFPKTTTRKPKSYKAWCIRNGYPKKLADSYGEHFYVGITTIKWKNLEGQKFKSSLVTDVASSSE